MKLDGQRLSTAEIKVVTSGAFRAAYLQLAPEYERATQVKLATEFGPSTGTARNAIPIRLERGEAIDVVIMAASGIVELITRRKIRADSRVDLVQSEIGMAVKAGASKPDVSTVEKLKQVLLAAKSIAYSASTSGIYLSSELFPKLGIMNQIRNKTLEVPASAGRAVATGKAEIGFQQIGELLPVRGIDIIRGLPTEVQRITPFRLLLSILRRRKHLSIGLRHRNAMR